MGCSDPYPPKLHLRPKCPSRVLGSDHSTRYPAHSRAPSIQSLCRSPRNAIPTLGSRARNREVPTIASNLPPTALRRCDDHRCATPSGYRPPRPRLHPGYIARVSLEPWAEFGNAIPELLHVQLRKRDCLAQIPLAPLRSLKCRGDTLPRRNREGRIAW